MRLFKTHKRVASARLNERRVFRSYTFYCFVETRNSMKKTRNAKKEIFFFFSFFVNSSSLRVFFLHSILPSNGFECQFFWYSTQQYITVLMAKSPHLLLSWSGWLSSNEYRCVSVLMSHCYRALHWDLNEHSWWKIWKINLSTFHIPLRNKEYVRLLSIVV